MKTKKEKQKKESHFKRNLISIIVIVILSIALVYLYSHFIGTKGLKLREYNIINENIPSSFDGFSIVQFSDLEYNTTFSLDNLKEAVKKINDLNPDIVVFTGDLVKGKYELEDDEKKSLIEILGEIDPLIAKYSIKGDDDYTGIYDEVMATSGFKDITNSYELIYYKGLTPIVLYGLGSNINGNSDFESTFKYPSDSEDTTYMATYRILMAHEPDLVDDIKDYNISLMLSGHSHNSELNIPYLKMLYGINGATKYYDESYKVDGTDLYISSGLGTSKFKVRLFSKPSISIFRLYTD